MPFLSETASIKTASSSSTTPKSPTVNISETPLAEVKVVDGKIYPDVSELNLEESFPHLSLDCSLDNPYFWEELSLQNQIRKEDILSILMNIRQMDTLMSEKIQFDSAVALMNFAKNNTRLRDELVLVDACQDVLTLFCQLNRTRTMLLVDPSADEANSVHKEDTTATNVDDPSSSLKTILALITVHLLESKQSILDLTPVKVKAIRTCLRYLEVIDVDTIEIKSVFMRCHSKELHQLAKEGRQRLEKRIERMPFYEPNSMQYRNDHEIRALLLLWEAETLSLKVEPQSVKKRGNTVPHTTAVLLQPGKENDSYYIAELSAKLAGCKTEEDKFNVKHVLRNLDIVLAVVNRALMFFFDMPGFDPRKDKVGQYYIDFATRDVDLITLIQIIQDISIARGLRVLAALTFAFCIPMQIKSSSMAPQDSIMCLNFLASCEESYLEESFLVLMPNRDSLLKITRQEVQAAIFCGLERCDKSIVELLHYREKSAELEESEAELIRLRKYLEELGKKGDFIPILSHLAASLSNRKRFEVADFILVNICSLKNFDLINKLVKCKGIHILLLVYASKDTDSQTRSVLAQAVCILLTGNKAPPAFQTLSMEIWILDCFNYLQLNGHSGYVRVTTRGHEDLARIKNYVKSSNTFGWYEWSTKENVITTDLRSSPDCIYNGVAGSESVLDYLDLRKYRATRDVVALLRTVHLGTARTLDGALVLLNMARTDQVTKKAICDANGVKLLSKAFYPTVPARRQIALTIAITLVEILPYSSLSKSERTRKKAKCYGLVNKHANLSKIVSAKADNITTLGIKEEPTAYDCLDKQGSENSIRKIITLTSTGFALEEHLLCVQNEKGDYASKRKLFFWEDIDGFLRELEKGGDLPGEKVNAGFVSPWDEFQFKYSDGEFFSIRFGTYATRKILLDDAIDRIKRLRKDEAFIQGSIDTGLAVPRIRNPIFADNPQFLGVSVYHLQEHFLAALQKIEEFSSSSSFYELENLHKDSSFVRHVGQSTICPIDGEVGSAYVHTLFGEDHVGPATHVLSWTWSYTVEDVVDSLHEFCLEESLNPKRTYIWICCLCLNQHRIAASNKSGMVSSAPVDFKEEFESRVLGIGRVLSLMTPWDDPRNLKRIWCIFEIFTALSSECSFSVVLPGREKSRMSKMVLSGAHGVEALFRALARIDIETAEASVQEDKENILKIIADQPNGFHAVNSTVRERLRGWIRKVLYSFVDKRSKEAKEISPDKDGLSSEPFDSFCRKVSDVLERIGDLEAALDLRRRAEEKQLSNLKNDVLSSATASSHKGRALAAEGHIDEALDVLYQALSVQDPKQYETTKTCFEIGLLLHTTGRNVQALGVLKQCLVSQQVFADAKRDTAITESKIGAICGELGYAKEALNRTRKALLALETDGGPNHPDTAACRVILASFLPNENDALNMLSQGQSAQESILGLKHPDLANTYRRKGDVLRRMNNLVEAEIFYKKAIEIYENGNIVAMNLDAFAMVCASLSLIAFCRKDRGLAASYHSKAVGFLQTASCTSEIILKVNAIYDFYGEALFQQECPEISLALYQQSENHDRILDIALNYANQSIRAFSDKQTRLEALALKSKAFSAIKDCPLDSKQQLIALYVDTGNKECENENGDGALGLLLLQQGATAIKELLGKGELELATCYDTMALALSKNGNIMGALKYFEKSIGALEAFGTHVQNWRIYVTQARIAECKNDPQTALKFYEKTVSALKSAGAQEGDRRLAEGWSRIEALAKQLGDL